MLVAADGEDPACARGAFLKAYSVFMQSPLPEMDLRL
jgi:hypothetical protein